MKNKNREKIDNFNSFTEFMDNILNIVLSKLPIILSLIAVIVSWIMENIIAIICILVTTIIFIIYIIVEKSRKIKGTFAVSAFIFCKEENQLLLYRSENEAYKGKNFYVQPSIFYKKKKTKKNKGILQTPYEKLADYLNDELGIYLVHLQPITLQPLKYDFTNSNQILPAFLKNNEKQLIFNQKGNIDDVEESMHNYRNNEISLSPWLTIVEKNQDTLKSSKEQLHIDFYYVFYLNQKNNIKTEIETGRFKLVSREELSELIKNKQTHGDLLAIYDILVYAKNRIKPYPKISIVNCTFTCQKKTAYWRVTENCNCDCQYCFIGKAKSNDSVIIDDNIIQKVKEVIEKNDIKKLVISGGEPLLVKNLSEVVEEISKVNDSELSISICTNGLVKFSDFSRLSEITKFKKFVISVDGYDNDSYGKCKKNQEKKNLDDVIAFINAAKKQNIRVAINVILSQTLKEHFDEYISLLNTLKIDELSISTLIANNDRNRKAKNYLNNTSDIINFYNYIVNEKMEDLKFLEKIDFILPICSYSKVTNECEKNKNLMYISPDGIAIPGCTENSHANSDTE